MDIPVLILGFILVIGGIGFFLHSLEELIQAFKKRKK